MVRENPVEKACKLIFIYILISIEFFQQSWIARIIEIINL